VLVLYSVHFYTTHTQGPRNRHGWIDQATCLILRRRRAQTFVRVNQQVSSCSIFSDFFLFFPPEAKRCIIDDPSFERWGVVSFADSLDCVGIIGKDVTSTSKVFGSFSPGLFLSGFFYTHQRRQQDVLPVFDDNDPTAARRTTRENARELCSEHMTEWASSSNSGDLTKLRIGIPQVCARSHHQSIIRFF
jgi:hypothetical protein